jgi:uncharacterized repeat protein (TIGR03803 family)
MKFGLTMFCTAALAALVPHSSAHAQSSAFDTLYDFSATSGSDSNNLDGAFPEAPLLLSGSTLYGTAIDGGTAGNGTIFSIYASGSNFSTLHSFSPGGANSLGNYTNSDGTTPFAGLILSSNSLYGTTAGGGSGGTGTVFKINQNGLGFTNLHSFTATSGSPLFANSDGANPVAGLVLVGNTLYGTAQNGGNAGNGTVFKIDTSGSNFSVVYSFSLGANNASGIYTNGDGAIPVAELTVSGRTLFGLAQYGGHSGSGTAFSINIDTLQFTNLYSFNATTYDAALALYINSDGAFPVSGLILSGNTLYGTAQKGGSAGTGTVFSIETNGSAFTNLYSFSAPTYDVVLGDYTNSDGFFPLAPLILSGTTLYGTAEDGGSADAGTVFSLNTNGSNFTTLYTFAPGTNNAANVFTNIGGALPVAGLTLSSNTLYGTAAIGGAHGEGTLFALNLPAPPSLAITYDRGSVVISWPATPAHYILQTATDLVPGSWINDIGPIFTDKTNNVAVIGARLSASYWRLQQQ